MPTPVIFGSDGAATEVSGSDELDETWNGSTSTVVQVFHGSDGAATKFIGADESVETLNGSTSFAEGEENLQRDLRLILQEQSSNVIKKWGNSEQWVLEL